MSAFPILTGWPSRRAAGVRKELLRRANSAHALSVLAEENGQVEFAASLRGKSRGYREAVDLVRALESGRNIGKARRAFRGNR